MVLIYQKLLHFAETLDLDQAGEASMKKLLELNPQLENPIYLLSLTEETFVNALGVNGSKLYNSIQKIRNDITESKLADACGAFGSGLGESLLSQVEETFGKLVSLSDGMDNFGP